MWERVVIASRDRLFGDDIYTLGYGAALGECASNVNIVWQFMQKALFFEGDTDDVAGARVTNTGVFVKTSD